MKSDELERLLEAARDYNEPPEPPREEMWAAISGALPGEGSEFDRWRERRRSKRLPGWTPWAIGLAATMTVGFGLGRIAGPPVVAPTGAAVQSAAEESGSSLSVRLAAADHLGEAEIMLTLFRTSGSSDDDRAATARWARDLLATTRLMLDSRAGQDPEMAQLLEDLELVLVQIASSAEGPSHQELIEEGIDERQLLSKLRSAAPPVDMSL